MAGMFGLFRFSENHKEDDDQKESKDTITFTKNDIGFYVSIGTLMYGAVALIRDGIKFIQYVRTKPSTSKI